MVRPSGVWQKLVVVAFAIAVWVGMWWRVILAREVVYLGDVSAQNVPFRLYVARHIQKGNLPLWSSDLMTGFPLVAEQSGEFSPFTWLLVLGTSKGPWLFSVLTGGVYLVAWSGMWTMARQLGVGRWGAALAATGYAYCSPLPARHVFSNMLEVMALFPWVMLGVERLVKARGRQDEAMATAIVGSALGLQMLAFYPQVTLFSLIAAGAYCLLRQGLQRTRRRLKLLAAATAMGICIGSAQYLPFGELARWNRAGQPAGPDYVKRYSPRARQLAGTILPGYWGRAGVWLGGGNYAEACIATGIVVMGLVLAAVGLPQGGFPKRLLLAMALGAAVVSFPSVFQTHRVLGVFPVFGAMRALGRCWFIASWALALVAGWSAEQATVLAQGRRAVTKTAAALGALVVLLIAGASALSWPSIAKAFTERLQSILGTIDFMAAMPAHWRVEYGLTGAGTLTAAVALASLGAAGWLAGRGRREIALAVLIVAVVAEGYHVVQLYVCSTEAEPIYGRPWTADAMARAGGGCLARQPGDVKLAIAASMGLLEADPVVHMLASQCMVCDRPLLWGIRCVDGYGAQVLQPKDLSRLFGLAGMTRKAPGAVGKEAQRRAVILGLLGANFLIGTSDTVLEGRGVRKLAERSPVALWMLDYAQPAARVVGVGRRVKTGEEAMRLTAAGNPELLEQAVVEVNGGTARALPGRAMGTVTIREELPGYWDLMAKTSSGGLLVLSDRAYPGWQAWLDGRRAWWGRAYGVLKCTAVPPGEHVVRFVYWPTSSVVGQFLLMVGIAAVCVSGVIGVGGRMAKNTKEKLYTSACS